MVHHVAERQRPLAIRLFAALFVLSSALSLVLAVTGASSMSFGFAITPEAARTLAMRILAIRLFGIAFALSLLVMIVLAGSKGARSALIMRWLLGLITSAAFLRSMGLIPSVGSALAALSAVQLIVEGAAILILFGDDAASWFNRQPYYLGS